MSRLRKIVNPVLTTPMAARFVTIIKENNGVATVDYFSDEEMRHPVRANISPKAMVLSIQEYNSLIGEAKTPVAPEKMRKAPSETLQSQKPRSLRKAKNGREGDKDHSDEIEQRGAMKFPHSKEEEEWADHLKFDPKRDGSVWDYPTYRQTGIDDKMFIYGKEAEKQMKNNVKEDVDLDLNTEDL